MAHASSSPRNFARMPGVGRRGVPAGTKASLAHAEVKYSHLEWIAMVLVIISSSQAFLAQYPVSTLFGTAVYVFGVWLLTSRKIQLSFLYLLIGITIWLSFITLKFEVFNVVTAIGLFNRILIGYLVVQISGQRYPDLLITWVVRLTVISLVGFVISNLMPGLLMKIINSLGSYRSFFVVNEASDNADFIASVWDRYSFVVFTFSPDRLHQNHGFMWEPGAFATVLNLALTLDLLQGRTKLDWRKIVLICGILSAMSTTGVLVFFVIFAFWLSRLRGWGPVLSIGAVLGAILAAISFNFLLPKILTEFQNADQYIQNSDQWGLTRWSSFLLDSQDFLENPIFGRGIYMENRYTGHLLAPSHNGLSDFCSRYGAFGFCVLMANFYLTGFRLSKGDHWAALLLFGVILISGWSERFFELPLFTAVLLLHFALPRTTQSATSNAWTRSNSIRPIVRSKRAMHDRVNIRRERHPNSAPPMG